MKKMLSMLLLGATALAGYAADDFNRHFNDSTLRLDYVFAADSLQSKIYVNKLVSSPGWHGRRHNLDSLPLKGTGNLTVTDKATGDTIYRHSFCSLFEEWLSTDEALTTPKAFENTFLIPMPKAEAVVSVELFNKRRDLIASGRHTVNPADILIHTQSAEPLHPYKYVHRAANPDEAIDVVILAEGYKADQADDFYAHAQAITDEILRYEPYSRYADKFNFIAVAVPSVDEGVSVPLEGDWKDTAYGSHFSTFYSDRYLTIPNVYAIHDSLRGIPYEHIIILANTDVYGGGGIYNSYTLSAAKNKNTLPVVVHEFGHSFGGLADEYFYETGEVMADTYPLDVEPWEQNITTLVDFDSKWKDMLAPGTPQPTLSEQAKDYPVGVYEGGGYSVKGIYRPADECRMRNNTYPTFCPVCTRAIERIILFYLQ